MEEGYPGNLYTTVTYKITNDNSVEIKYEAQTDKTTVINLTQHSYFNLSGDFNQSILNHPKYNKTLVKCSLKQLNQAESCSNDNQNQDMSNSLQ